MSDRTMIVTGWILSGLYGAFTLLASVLPKLGGMAVAAETMASLGWPEAPVLLIGALELICVVLYLIPATALLGGILTMAILGGAMVTQMRAGTPLLSNQLFSIWLGLWLWIGLWLRDPRIRTVLPLMRRP